MAEAKKQSPRKSQSEVEDDDAASGRADELYAIMEEIGKEKGDDYDDDDDGDVDDNDDLDGDESSQIDEKDLSEYGI